MFDAAELQESIPSLEISYPSITEGESRGRLPDQVEYVSCSGPWSWLTEESFEAGDVMLSCVGSSVSWGTMSYLFQ